MSIIAKGNRWRLSFSISEARLIMKEPDNTILYQSLKYLAKVSGLYIESYWLKELTCSYIIHCQMNNVQKKSELIQTINDLITFFSHQNNVLSRQ